MADLIVAEETRDYLIAQGLVSAWGDQGAAAPPCIVDPRTGAMAVDIPDGRESVVTILTGTEIVNEWLQSRFLQDRPIEFIVRTRKRAAGELLQRSIRALMVEKENVMMGRLLVERSSQFRGVQPIASDDASWTLSQSFRVSFRVASLTV